MKSSWYKFLLKGNKTLLIGLLLSIIASMVLGYNMPQFVSRFYAAIGQADTFFVAFSSLVVILLLEVLNKAFYSFVTNKYVQDLIGKMRNECFERWLKAPMKKKYQETDDDFPLGEVLSRLMNDTDAVKEMINAGAFEIFIDLVFIFSSLVGFLKLDSAIGSFLITAEIVVCLLLFLCSKFMATIFMEVRKITGMMARVLTDLIQGVKEIFFHPNDHYITKRGDHIFELFLSKQLRANIWDASYYSFADSLFPILLMLIIIVVPYTEVASVAVFAALIDLIQRSINPIKEVAGKVSVIQRGKTGLLRLQSFLEHFELEVQGGLQEKIDFSEFKFYLKHFSFNTKAGHIPFELKDISFELKKGELLGIIGQSGCGKSTLLKLFSAQYGVFKGNLNLIDNTHLNLANMDDLKRFQSYVSLISQDSHVFTETLAFNLGLGKLDQLDLFWQKAKMSIRYLDEWSIQLQDNIEPESLSHGQRQLIAALRALYLSKAIIMLDEISTGLDPKLEWALRDLMSHFRGEAIFIIVTHRLETIMNADKILILDQGQQIALGTPLELKSQNTFHEFIEHLR